MKSKKSGIGVEKVALACSSFLGLSLGMGAVTPAHADLIITQFDPSATTTYYSGAPVAFGPSWDPAGFTAFRTTPFTVFDIFNLSASPGNGVADVGCPLICTLQTFAPGSSVDGSANFGSGGQFPIKTYNGTGFTYAPDGDYYFGLSDGSVPAADPYGWLEITLDNNSVILDRFAFQDNAVSPAVVPTDPTEPTDVPEPATLSLFAIGGAAVLAARRRRKRMQAAA